jgi:hypothetical protein
MVLKKLFAQDTDIQADQDSWSSPPVGFLLLISRANFSTSSVAIGTGSKTFTLAATGNQEWANGNAVLVTSTADEDNTMTGTVTSYNSSTQALVINVTSVTGSGTINSWVIEDPAPPYALLIEDDGDKLLIE